MQTMQITNVVAIGTTIDFQTVFTDNGGTTGTIEGMTSLTWRLNENAGVDFFADEKTF